MAKGVVYEKFCFMCWYYNGDQKCWAFPDGIPDKVFRGEKQHDAKIEGDNGYRFVHLAKPKPKGFLDDVKEAQEPEKPAAPKIRRRKIIRDKDGLIVGIEDEET